MDKMHKPVAGAAVAGLPLLRSADVRKGAFNTRYQNPDKKRLCHVKKLCRAQHLCALSVILQYRTFSFSFQQCRLQCAIDPVLFSHLQLPL
ncbi:hypothetical protein [Taibaiella helva]|uniref:hypothetical protein n=1 Tax=Taibaiella helva TaxID=2301235 RepID=UPI00130028A9|nr:hypothetical protein [Taibaiella helva]